MLAARAVARGAALGVLVCWEPLPLVGVAPGVPVALGKCSPISLVRPAAALLTTLWAEAGRLENHSGAWWSEMALWREEPKDLRSEASVKLLQTEAGMAVADGKRAVRLLPMLPMSVAMSPISEPMPPMPEVLVQVSICHV